MKVEVCLISARGLRRPTSLWKLQWFAVGWINPNNKYCTKIDASGSSNPTWKTKFSIQVDVDESEESHHSLQDLALHVQVFSREPIFLRERLQGTATILLKEFFAKYNNHANRNSSSSSVAPLSDNRGGGNEDVGSFQLRKGNSGKPLGFVDVSIRVYDEREGYGGLSYSGTNTASGEGIIDLAGTNYGNEMYPGTYHPQSQFQSHLPPSNGNWQQQSHPNARQVPDQAGTNNGNERYLGTYHPQSQFQSHIPPSSPNWQQQSRHPNARQVPINSNTPASAASNPTYYRPPPPPPPPPSHVGFVSTFYPRTDAGRSGGGNDFLTGATAGALGAGAIIFGDDYMSGFNDPPGLQDHSGYS